MIGSRYWSIPGIEEPSPYPASTTPTVQTAPPATCQRVNERTGTSSTPQSGFNTVRTTGMKRASTIALPCPYLASSSSARSTPSSRLLRLVRPSSARPPRRPIR